MLIKTLPVGHLGTNCYVVTDEQTLNCAVIDPGEESNTILDYIESNHLHCKLILLTHGHFDHVGGVEAIVRATGCALWMRESDYSQFPNPINAHYYPIANCDFTAVCFCEDFEEIPAGGLTFTVYATPGHTYGSVCYLCDGAIFSGDTLFAGSCGRTDLPGGDPSAMGCSLARLSELAGDFAVYPGHGESTTLAREKRYNPYLR